MSKSKEEKKPETPAERRERERTERDRAAYRAYWLTLDPRDQERMPKP